MKIQRHNQGKYIVEEDLTRGDLASPYKGHREQHPNAVHLFQIKNQREVFNHFTTAHNTERMQRHQRVGSRNQLHNV